MSQAAAFTPEPFRCEVNAAGDGLVSLVPAGELDMATVGEVDRALREAQARAHTGLVVDLRRLTFLDCAGLQVLLAAADWARRAGVQLTFVRGPRAVHRLFELTGLDRTLPVVDLHPRDAALNGRNGHRPDLAGVDDGVA